MNDGRVIVAQAGIANHGRTILNAVRDSGNLKLVACYDPNEEASREVAREFSVDRAPDFDALIQRSDVDAVVLATPNHLHYAQAKKAAAAGKHVFVEKPIANTIAEAQEMIRFMNDAGRTLMVGHNTRRRRVFRRAKALLDERRIGTIAAVEANLSRPAGLQSGVPRWKTDPVLCPLLPMIQLGIHFVDTISYLFSPIRKVACVASHAAIPGDIYDVASAVLQLESGIPVVLTSSYVSADEYVLRIFGTEGTIHCFPLKLRLDVLKNGEVKETLEEDFSDEGAESYILEMREFGKCILDHTQPETDGGEALHALAAVEAMMQSVKTNFFVSVYEILKKAAEK
ncbi:MAG: Gfo/Idh/MocA family oxidoreductase [Bacteroidota bacterium]|nr:Gfo/Idh/MocA family oxidoreductase [Bacteroidota bacterium]